jgi:hypothetical protein
MKRSGLERFNDKILIKIIDIILKDFDGDEWKNVFDDALYYETYESNIGALGIDVETIDVDYMYSLITLNIRDDFKIPLNRPNLAKYAQDVDVSERVIQTNRFRNFVYSYDEGIVTEKFRFEESNGIFSIYDGKIINTKVNDSEDLDWEYLSPYKIKNI